MCGPPDRYRRVGPPRRHAGGTGTQTISFAASDLNGSRQDPQGKIADALAIDPGRGR